MNAPTGTRGVPAEFTAAIYRDGAYEPLGEIFGPSGKYDEVAVGDEQTHTVTVEEDQVWLLVWAAEDVTDPSRYFEGVIPNTDGELFDCLEPVVDPEVTYAVECAVGDDDSDAVTFEVDNTRSERAVDVRIKKFGSSVQQLGQVAAGQIREFYEQDVVHRDKFTIEVTVSDTEPAAQSADGAGVPGTEPNLIAPTVLEEAPRQQPLSSVEIVVEPGDTLSEIAAAHGVPMAELLVANGIDNPRLIRIGQVLTVRSRLAATTETVVVEPGDTLSEIAAEHGVSVGRLMAFNGIDNPGLIRVGQRLAIEGEPQHDSNSPDRSGLIAALVAQLVTQPGRILYAADGDGQLPFSEPTTIQSAPFTAMVDDIEVSCPGFEAQIDISSYCASGRIHIVVFTGASDIDGYITIYENGREVDTGFPNSAGLYIYDEEFVLGATYLVEATATGVSDEDSFEPVTLSHDIDCETPFDPTLDVTVACSDRQPIVKANADNTNSDVAAEFTLTLIIEGLEPIQIPPFNVNPGLEIEVDVQNQAGIPSIALEDATWRIEWEANGVDTASLTESGSYASMPTDCIDPVGPFECSDYQAPIQVLLTASGIGYDVSALDVASGSYQVVSTIPFTSTDPLYTQLNGVGLNPVDGVAYGVMELGADGESGSYLVRFDTERIEYLALMPAMSNSATVDQDGSFVWMVGGSLYLVDDVADLVGYAGHDDPRITDYSGISPVSYTHLTLPTILLV